MLTVATTVVTIMSKTNVHISEGRLGLPDFDRQWYKDREPRS